MITLAPVTAQHTARVASLRAILDATEAVDSYCVDYLISGDGGGLVVDRESFQRERLADLLRVLAELDGIVTASREIAESGAVTADAQLFASTVTRARLLAAAIREAMGYPTDPAPAVALVPPTPVFPIVAKPEFKRAMLDEVDEDTVPRADVPAPFAPKSAFEHTGFEAGAL